MELDTLVENADFDDVDDNDFGEELGGDESIKVLAGDDLGGDDLGGDDLEGGELGGDEPKLERFSSKIDLSLTNKPEEKEGNLKEDIDFGLEVRNGQELKKEEGK